MDVLDGFLELARESAHEFFILCPHKAAHGLRARVKARGASIGVYPIQTSWFSRGVAALWRVSGTLRARFRFGIRSRIDRAADQVEADFVWFVAAGVHFTDRPYMTVVWDIQHIITPWFPEMSSKGMWDQRELSLAWFLRRAAVVVTGTERGREELEQYYQLSRDRFTILPHPTPRFALDTPAENEVDVLARLGIFKPFLLYPAQYWAHKNHVNLLLALQRLRSEHCLDIDLVLVGSDKGNRSYVFGKTMELGLEHSVHFMGFVSRSDLIQLYRKAFALVYSSWCGPENLPPLEAFALGCPVVASRIPGAEEQLSDSALFCDPGNPSDIARCVMELWSDSRLREVLIQKGHQRARKWTANHYVQGIFSAIDRFEPVVRNWSSTGRLDRK